MYCAKNRPALIVTHLLSRQCRGLDFRCWPGEWRRHNNQSFWYVSVISVETLRWFHWKLLHDILPQHFAMYFGIMYGESPRHMQQASSGPWELFTTVFACLSLYVCPGGLGMPTVLALAWVYQFNFYKFDLKSSIKTRKGGSKTKLNRAFLV